MKPLSITQRLTLTSALLTAAVLLPAAAVFYYRGARAYERESAEDALAEARHLRRSILARLDKYLLVEFDGRPVAFPEMRTQENSWAIFRGSGQVEHAQGGFLDGLQPRVARGEELLAHRDLGDLRVASVPLAQKTGLALDELSPQVREVILGFAPAENFLTARRDIRKGQGVLSVRLLDRGYLLELKVSLEGEVLKKAHDSFKFSELYLDYAPEETRPSGEAKLSWQAFEGQAIAVLTGQGSSGEPVRVGMNRLGELANFAADGRVSGFEPASRVHVVAAVDVSRELARKKRLLLGLTLGAPVLWLCLVLVGWYVARRAMSPVESIVESTRGVRPSHLDDRVPVGASDDELSRIAKTINDMLDRLETGYRRERRFTGDASHELRGPLTKIQADVELALSRPRSSEEYREVLERIRGYSSSMKRLVESLLLLARLDNEQEHPAFEPVVLAPLVREMIGTFPRAEAGRIACHAGDGEILVEGQPSLISTAVHNLIENALRYSPEAWEVDVRIRRDGSRVAVEVEDRGPGIPEGEREHVLDRFYRVDTARVRETGGCGLGLAIVRSVARLHGGEIRLEEGAEGGVCARLLLPASILPSRALAS